MSRHERNVTLAWVVGILTVVAIVFLLFAWPFKKPPADQWAVSYGGGPFESQHYQGTFEPGSSFRFNGWFDKWFEYPATVRSYIVSKKGDEGDVDSKDSIRATTSDQQQVQYEVVTNFKLNTNLLRKFHEQLGLKFEAWEDSGWDRMLRDSFRQQLENSLQTISRRFDVAAVWSSGPALEEIEDELGIAFNRKVVSQLGDEYFCGPSFIHGKDVKVDVSRQKKGEVVTEEVVTPCPPLEVKVKKVTIPKQVQGAFEENRTSEIKIKTKENEVRQRREERLAIRQLQNVLSTNYVLLKGIEEGKIDFWVLPGNNGLTLQTPNTP